VPGLTNPYGSCGPDPSNASLGANSTGCAWVYGADIASLDASQGPPLIGSAPASFLTSASSALAAQGASVSGKASAYGWWLDVETANTWQSGGAGLAMNAAVIEGMLQYLKSLGASTVGIYSTSGVWQTIVGGQNAVESNWTASGHPAPSPAYGVPDWIPGAGSQSGAVSNCALASFTRGKTALTQWVQNSLDYDQACS
jgi:GH25 family lysozyme M1 (1,4-beta-N-acetylmuramidase)